jgi:16S rRNA A1518/A1519 N6-dimethyltransferase RsmA/KsgA/DIM1 with predicted DNA glycosylase/AP lyase activity
MILLFIFFGIPLLTVITIFAFPIFSPIPYFPSNHKDIDLIIKALGLKHNQTVVDLGAGDGIVIFSAAHEALKRQLNTTFIAVELNPLLYFYLQVKRLRHPNKKNIHIVRGNMFTLNYKQFLPKVKSQLVFYIYISPWLIDKTIKTIQSYYQHFYIISYMYKVEGARPTQTFSGVHKVFRYLYD